ncbi:MAG: response regulator transcription factor [Chloroflexi bacterium]|nr:response regulator transcription factor [Chloroflexota bacterium]
MLVDDHPLFMEGVWNLLTDHGIQVVGTASDGLEALEKARALYPDAVIFDWTDPNLPFILGFFKDHPEFLLIGLDPNSDTVAVLSNHRRTVLAIDDLARVIRQETRKQGCEKIGL